MCSLLASSMSGQGGKRGSPRVEKSRVETSDPPSMTKAARGHDHVVKVIVIGESGVGKTSMVAKLRGEAFEEGRSATIGAELFPITMVVDGVGGMGGMGGVGGTENVPKRVKCSIWDTAGQEKFHSLTGSFYRGAQLVLFCFDVTDVTSFEKIQYWFHDLVSSPSLSHPNIVKLLIGTKLDMPRVVKRQDAIDLAAANDCVCYLETSSKTGSGVKECFEHGIACVLKTPELCETSVSVPLKSALQRGESMPCC